MVQFRRGLGSLGMHVQRPLLNLAKIKMTEMTVLGLCRTFHMMTIPCLVCWLMSAIWISPLKRLPSELNILKSMAQKVHRSSWPREAEHFMKLFLGMLSKSEVASDVHRMTKKAGTFAEEAGHGREDRTEFT